MKLSEEVIRKAWEHARTAGDVDPSTWRMDECGAWVRREHYGQEHSEFGWRIENVCAGGPDVPENLRVMHVGNAFDRAAGSPKCAITADRNGLKPWEHVSAPRNRAV